MIFQNAKDFLAAANNGLYLLGLDVGAKKIGIALGNMQLKLASPIENISGNLNCKIQAIQKIIEQWSICGIVIGIPLGLDGSISEQAKKMIVFAKSIEYLGLPIFVHDERFSTKIAQSIMKSHNVSRKKRDTSDDMIAASIMLQNFFQMFCLTD